MPSSNLATLEWGRASARQMALATPLDHAPSGRLLRRRVAADPDQAYYLYVPRRRNERAPLLVTVHGSSRNAREHGERFADLAERYGVVLVAPLFARGRFPDFHCLGRSADERADLALERIVAEVSSLVDEVESDRLRLFGFGAGGQFVHRYALAHPERVAGFAVAATSDFTYPDPALPFPQGTGTSPALSGQRFFPDAFLRVPGCVLVSDRDRPAEAAPSVEHGESWLTAMSTAARERGLDTRYALARFTGSPQSFCSGMRRGRLGEKAFAFLFGPRAVPGRADV